MVALVVLRNKPIKPLLAAAQRRRKSRGAQNPTPIDKHYETIRTAMQGVFDQLGIGRLNIDNYFFKFCAKRLTARYSLANDLRIPLVWRRKSAFAERFK